MRSHQLHTALLPATLMVWMACAGSSGKPKYTTGGYQERGIASWYGPNFHGKRTANGEIYDMYQMTAAHRELPFDSVVEVRNRDNGRTIRVRINDRGPFVRGRIIDLSYAGAQALQMVGPGTARVEIRLLSSDTRLSGAPRYAVQIGAFSSRANAEKQAAKLKREYSHATLVRTGGLFRVQVGPFDKRKRAQKTVRQLRRRYPDAFVVRVPTAYTRS